MPRIARARRTAVLAALAASGVAAATPAAPATAAAPAATAPVTLEGRAVLGARTFADGPVSGTLIAPANGVTPPFPSQPVQGFSAVVRARGGGYWAMGDNGFGSEANSRDFLLRIYRILPEFETRAGGSGTIAVGRSIELSDPEGFVPFPLEREDRRLTGGDFDPESLRIDADGELWLGDEFGPYLLHADAEGRLLEPPIALPGVSSPDSPPLGGTNPEANLGRSRGYEGMAISPDGRTLYPMLEGTVDGDPPLTRRIHEFDTATSRYTGRRFTYATERPDHAIGDFTALDRNRFVVIERDNLQGPAAAFKRISVVDLRRTDADGLLRETELVDLLEIRDPAGISEPAREGDIGLGDPFSFPFQTIESVLPIGARRLLVVNDNNFPFSAGRNATRPDDNEAIVLRVPRLP